MAFLLTLGLSACASTRFAPPEPNPIQGTQALILSPTENSFYVFDLLTHRVRASIYTGQVPRELILGTNGLFFISNAIENSLTVYQRVDRQTLYRIGKIGTPSLPGKMLFHPAQGELYVLLQDKPILMVYDTRGGTQLPTLKQAVRLNESGLALALSPDKQSLFVAGKTQLMGVTRENENFRASELLALPENAAIQDMQSTSDRLLLLDQFNDQLHFVTPTDSKIESSLALTEQSEDDSATQPVLPERMVSNHAGTKLYITGQANSSVMVVNLKEQSLLQSIALNGEDANFKSFGPTGLDISPNDKRLYVTNQMGRNLAIIETHSSVSESDNLLRNIGTAPHEALLLPLGALKVIQSIN